MTVISECSAVFFFASFLFLLEVLALHGGGSNANIMKYQVPLSQSKPGVWKTCLFVFLFFFGGGVVLKEIQFSLKLGS